MKNALKVSLVLFAAAIAILIFYYPGVSTVSSAQGHVIITGHSPSVSSQVSSSNWAGYVVASSFSSPSHDVTAVKGSWIVQTANPTKQSTYSAQWIGIGGYFSNDNSLIQTGTSSDYSKGASYYAWYELLPASETQISLKVSPGDNMSAYIYEVKPFGSQQEWNITIRDNTTGAAFSKLVNYSSSMLSAEWIEERPALCFAVCRLTNLANFGTSYYGQYYTSQPSTDFATLSNVFASIGHFPNQNITMVSGSTILAEPSSLLSNLSSFTVTEPTSSSHGGHNK